MKIIDAHVDWNVEWDSPPKLVVTVDKLPDETEARWHRSVENPAIYWAEQDGFVRYRHWKGPGNDGGSYGYSKPITLVDGTKVSLLGAWSSRDSVVNMYGDTPDIVDMIILEQEVGSRWSGALTIERAEEAAKLVGVTLLEHHPWGNEERTWYPDPREGPISRCLACMARAKKVDEELKCACPDGPTLE